MSSAPDVVAVCGATGQQGGATARALRERGLRVRALVRDPGSDAARALLGLGAELAQADLTDATSTQAALAGADAAFVMATMTGDDGIEGEVRVGTTVADAAAAAGVGFVLYSSVGGAERHTGIPHFESKRRIEEHLETLALRTCFLRPTFFMDNLATYSRPRLVDGEIVVAMPLPAGKAVQMIAVSDIGRAAAALLADPDAAPAALEIVGDEVTGEDVARAFADRFGRAARYEALSLDVLAGDPDQQAMFAWFARPVAYEGDLAATRALVPDVLDLAAWLQTADVTPDES